MSVANGMSEVDSAGPSMTERAAERVGDFKETLETNPALNVENARKVGEARLEETMDEAEMEQMGAKRIGSLAIGIGVVGIVLNYMSDMDVVANSTGVVDVSSIFDTAGSGLNLLVVGVIIAAAAVLLNLWSGF